LLLITGKFLRVSEAAWNRIEYTPLAFGAVPVAAGIIRNFHMFFTFKTSILRK